MKTSQDFPKILSLLEKVTENLTRGGDPEHCKVFLDAYLIDIFAKQGQPDEAETKTVYEIRTVESILDRLTRKELSFLASGEGAIHDDLLARYPILQLVKEILSVYNQLTMLESRQHFLHKFIR
jgi:hypothetical protein